MRNNFFSCSCQLWMRDYENVRHLYRPPEIDGSTANVWGASIEWTSSIGVIQYSQLCSWATCQRNSYTVVATLCVFIHHFESSCCVAIVSFEINQINRLFCFERSLRRAWACYSMSISGRFVSVLLVPVLRYFIKFTLHFIKLLGNETNELTSLRLFFPRIDWKRNSITEAHVWDFYYKNFIHFGTACEMRSTNEDDFQRPYTICRWFSVILYGVNVVSRRNIETNWRINAPRWFCF